MTETSDQGEVSPLPHTKSCNPAKTLRKLNSEIQRKKDELEEFKKFKMNPKMDENMIINISQIIQNIESEIRDFEMRIKNISKFFTHPAVRSREEGQVEQNYKQEILTQGSHAERPILAFIISKILDGETERESLIHFESSPPSCNPNKVIYDENTSKLISPIFGPYETTLGYQDRNFKNRPHLSHKNGRCVIDGNGHYVNTASCQFDNIAVKPRENPNTDNKEKNTSKEEEEEKKFRKQVQKESSFANYSTINKYKHKERTATAHDRDFEKIRVKSDKEENSENFVTDTLNNSKASEKLYNHSANNRFATRRVESGNLVEKHGMLSQKPEQTLLWEQIDDLRFQSYDYMKRSVRHAPELTSKIESNSIATQTSQSKKCSDSEAFLKTLDKAKSIVTKKADQFASKKCYDEENRCKQLLFLIEKNKQNEFSRRKIRQTELDFIMQWLMSLKQPAQDHDMKTTRDNSDAVKYETTENDLENYEKVVSKQEQENWQEEKNELLAQIASLQTEKNDLLAGRDGNGSHSFAVQYGQSPYDLWNPAGYWNQYSPVFGAPSAPQLMNCCPEMLNASYNGFSHQSPVAMVPESNVLPMYTMYANVYTSNPVQSPWLAGPLPGWDSSSSVAHNHGSVMNVLPMYDMYRNASTSLPAQSPSLAGPPPGWDNSSTIPPYQGLVMRGYKK